MIGLAKNSVCLCPYSTGWKESFESEKALLIDCIGCEIIDVQHVGSTSIQGMQAKPVIDIAAAIRKLNDGFKLINSLESIGYHFKGSLGESHRFFFWKGNEMKNMHNLHIVEYGDENWLNFLLFRDYLNSNTVYKDRYSELKAELALQYNYDRETYTKRKTEFIKEVIQLARQESGKIHAAPMVQDLM